MEQTKQNKMDIPSFLQEVPDLTKPDENAKHNEKLVEIIQAMDEGDATIACRILARTHPIEMFTALVNEINDLRILRDNVGQSIDHYTFEGANHA